MSRRTTLSRILALMLLAAAGMPAVAEERESLILEVLWGRGKPADWSGTLEIVNGSFVSVTGPLLNEKDRVALADAGRIEWVSRTAGAVDSIRVEVQAAPDAELVWDTRKGQGRVALAEVLQQPYRSELDNGRFVIRRLRSDIVGIVEHPESYVFETGEQWRFSWYLDPALAAQLRGLSYRMRLVNDLTGSEVRAWSTRRPTVKGDRYETAETVDLPQREGVYSLRIETSATNMDIPELVTQFVVLAPGVAETDHSPRGGLVTVDSIDPQAMTGADRFLDDGASRLLSQAGITYRQSGTLAQRTSRRRERNKTMNWFAYRLQVEHPGRPHLLKIRYPADQRRRFVASIIEPVPSGKTRNIMDIGLTTEAEDGGDDLALRTKRIVFWPKTERPTIAFVNTLEDASAAVAGIEVLEAPAGLPAGPAANAGPGAQSLRGVYFEDPHLRMLGGRKSLDSDPDMGNSRRTDWVSWYMDFRNLLDALGYYGYNAIMMPAYTYGATLYPSSILDNNGRYDDGAHFSDNRNPVQKDLMRLLLNMAQREGITVVPFFAFYTRITELEEKLGSRQERIRSLDLMDNRGRPSREVVRIRDSADIGPYYDPLKPEVQKVVREVIAEFSGRYADSPALGDVAIQLNTTGWSQYPGMSWGYDPEVLKNFFAESNIEQPMRLDNAAQTRSLAVWLQEPGRWRQWRNWRNNAMARFYSDVADSLKPGPGDRRLVLAYMNTFTSRHGEDDYKDILDGTEAARGQLANKGIDPVVLGRDTDIRIWRPLRTPVPFYDHSVERGRASRHPQVLQLFEQAGADGIVEFMDYYESKVDDINRNYWFPVDYRMVATIPDPGREFPPLEGPAAWFVGGWQIPQ